LNSSPDADRAQVEGQPLLGADELSVRIEAIADQIVARHQSGTPAFVGIHTRGVTVAERVRALLAGRGIEVPLGTLDISFYRDDLDHRSTNPEVQASEIPFEVDGAEVIIFDDVLYTGRTIRAAIEGLMNYGRPAKIELAVLIDRGNREIPIQPDYVGETVETARRDDIRVRFAEHDDEDSIALIAAP
jgi:pyrimidine operon attenuation protein/uracil phosphoribosyltransferase